MMITAQRFGATLSGRLRDVRAAASDFLTSIDQPMTDQDARRMDVAFYTLGTVFLVLDLGLGVWAVLA